MRVAADSRFLAASLLRNDKHTTTALQQFEIPIGR